MGDPRKQKKKYKTPKHPWQGARISEELALVREYGLSNKKEIWRMASMLRNWQQQARTIIGYPEPQRTEAQKVLINILNRLDILPKDAQLDDILALNVKDVLERRLQTQIYKKGLASTIKQARQFIVHNKIIVNKHSINSPSYLVRVKDDIKFILGFNPKVALIVKAKVSPQSKELPKEEAPTLVAIEAPQADQVEVPAISGGASRAGGGKQLMEGTGS